MSLKAILSALASLMCLLFFIHPLSVVNAATAPPNVTNSSTLDSILSEYSGLKPKVMALAQDIREARKNGQGIESGKILLVRREVSEFVKQLRRYDKDHLRAAKGVKTYPDREKILRLFHASDAIYRLLEAETRSTDFQMLGVKYEDMWKQADAALAGDQAVDR
ncbi:MAG: hypothetical protein H0X01_10050 [Nitrospira sp.]|nr:hypothetical protein [Nitrospira sp.]